jgi:beta-glucosidase
MGFNGFVVGDWNGHGQVPGCTNTDCAQSFNAGVDMFMAPDSWRGLYENTLTQVQDGTISTERLDDAVRRILRVKLASGIYEKGLPSLRMNASDESQLGLAEHRAVARQAVRESMVLLKNNSLTLPLDPNSTILVVGDGANSISKASGGWTLSWQGTGHTNDEFPNGESILEGIRQLVNEAGGRVIYSESGEIPYPVDAVIAVYGEDPYAEFQGDREHLDFESNGFDVNLLAEYQSEDIPVVSVFLSGRPMWTNPEINNSNAFVAAWLPGSEGGGIADLLFQADPSYDFTGTLSFSWPASAVVSENSETLFELGYGLAYSSQEQLSTLPEVSGLENTAVASTGEFFTKGTAIAPWSLWLDSGELDKQIASYPTSVGGLIVSKTDYQAQEDALRINWTQTNGDYVRISTASPTSLARESNGAMELSFSAKSFSGTTTIQVGQCDENANCDATLPVELDSDWYEFSVSLSCFDDLGVDMSSISSAFVIKSETMADIGIANIGLTSDIDARASCDGR